MADRLRIIIEFSKGKERELQLYSKLLEFSVPAVAIKDILLGLIPLPQIDVGTNVSRKIN